MGQLPPPNYEVLNDIVPGSTATGVVDALMGSASMREMAVRDCLLSLTAHSSAVAVCHDTACGTCCLFNAGYLRRLQILRELVGMRMLGMDTTASVSRS